MDRINENLYFWDLMFYIREELTDDQWRSLILVRDGEALDLSYQVLILYADNRYSTFLFKKEVLEQLKEFLDKYRFIFSSGWSRDKIRHKFISALMEVISIGSSEYLVKHNISEYYFSRRLVTVNVRYARSGSSNFAFLRNHITSNYPNLPESYEKLMSDSKGKRYGLTPFDESLMIRYSYFFQKAIEKGVINPEKYKHKFLRENRWNLEKLSRCCSCFRNKYRERIFRNINRDLGGMVDCSSDVMIP